MALRSSGLLALIPERHPVSAAGPLQQIRRAGVRVAMDATGAGYASLTTLQRIQRDIIKLDRDLVRGNETEPQATALVGLGCPSARGTSWADPVPSPT